VLQCDIVSHQILLLQFGAITSVDKVQNALIVI